LGLLGILVSFFAFRHSFKGNTQQTNKTKEQNRTTEQQQEKPNPTGQLEKITVEVNLSKAESRRYYAEQDKTNRLQQFTFWATFGTFLALIAYTAVTYYMLREMQHTNKLTSDALELIRKMFNATQVAGFICQINQTIATLEGSDTMQVQISCNNRGKSSASDVTGIVKFDRTEFGKIVQHQERPINEKVILEGDGFYRMFAVTRSYSWEWIEKQGMTAAIEFSYGNGLDTVSQSYCWKLHTRMKERSFAFVDCANYDNAKKLLP
jgi:hypothetical protein